MLPIILASKMYLVTTDYIFKNHQGRNLSKPIFNEYNQYKPILNWHLTDITNTL